MPHSAPGPRFHGLPRRLAAAVALAAVVLGAPGGQASVTALVASRELPVRPPEPAEPRFTLLDPAFTSVTAANDYADPAMWRERYAAFAHGSLGTGVAIADYDADGRPDIFIVSKDGPSRLFRNLGGWKFADVTESAGVATPAGPWNHGATFTDVNNDGRPDLYVCRHSAPNLLFVNQGGGRFTEQAASFGLAIVDASVMGAFFDYDRDGWLDLYLQTNLLDSTAPQGQRDRLFRNNGNNSFTDVTDAMRVFGATQGHAATWWDFNHDHWPDLYVGNDFLAPDQLYQNVFARGLAERADAAVPYFSHFSMGSDLGDVNNDGQLDLFVADMLPTDRDQYVRGMLNLQATMARDIPTGAAAQYMRNVLYLSTGTARYAEGAFLAGIAASGWTWSPRFEDLDEDGLIDLHVTNGMVRDFLDQDLIAQMANLPFDQRRRLVLAAPALREPNRAYRNLGRLRFEETGASWGLARDGISFGSAFGDLDGDGDLDLVVANHQDNPSVYRNNSHEHHRVLFELQGTHSNRLGIGALIKIETGDRVQVRQLGLARGYASSSEPVIHFGLGEARGIDRVTITWPSGIIQTLADLPADHRYTLREPDQPAAPAPELPRTQFVELGVQAGLPATAAVEAESSEFRAQPLLPFRKQGVGPGLAIGDLDGDQIDDVVVGGLAGVPAAVFSNQSGRLVPVPAMDTPPGDVADAAPLIADFNRDGVPDLFIARGGVNLPAGSPGYQPRLLWGRGAGRFEPAEADALPALPVSAGPVVAADWNRDGWLDLFVGGRVVPDLYPTTPASALLTNRGGRFENTTRADAAGLEQAGLVNAALWSDVDGDGWTDLLVAGEWGGIRCWRNEAGQRLVEATQALGFSGAGRGLWQSIAAADFNGDGVMDYAVGNLGRNTRYHASPAAPFTLLRTPLTAQGRPQLVEAETRNGRLVPLRGRNQLAQVMPDLPRRFPTFRQYAAASLEQIIGTARIEAAEKFALTELRSGVLLSGAGGFRFQPLPEEAQLAPVFGLVAGDFDGDGRADLYAVQNWFAPNPEMGRFSGGVSLLLRGDGRGGFAPVAAGQSGLLVPGDAKGLAVLDLNTDGWPDFLVTRRGLPHLLFLNQGVAGQRSLAVRLVGSAGATPIANARIVVTDARGGTRTGDIHLGGGYLSQSAPELYVSWRREDLPLTVEVFWADGQRTRQTWNGTGTRLVLSAPPGRE